MKQTAIDYLTNLVLAERPAVEDSEIARLLREATGGMEETAATELIDGFIRLFGLIDLACIVDPQGPHAAEFRRDCLAILRQITGPLH